jgi:hypothetical protein
VPFAVLWSGLIVRSYLNITMLNDVTGFSTLPFLHLPNAIMPDWKTASIPYLVMPYLLARK